MVFVMAFPVYFRITLYETLLEGPVLLEDKLSASQVYEFGHNVKRLFKSAANFTSSVRVHTPIVLFKSIDKASVQLLKAFLKNEHASRVELLWYSIDDTQTKPKLYFRHILENVRLISIGHILPDIKLKSLERYDHMERLELAYEYVTWEFCKGLISYRDKWELVYIDEFKAGDMSPEELDALLSAPALTDGLADYFSKKKAGVSDETQDNDIKTIEEQKAETDASDTSKPEEDTQGWWYPIEEVSPIDGEAPEVKSVDFIEMEDALFRHNSSVFLPDLVGTVYPENSTEAKSDEPAGGDGSSALDLEDAKWCEGLAMVYQVLEHLQQYPDGFVCHIAGHTDTSGEPGYNMKLSSLRSRAVYYIIDGSDACRTAWGEQFKEETKDNVHTRNLDDLQQMLAWVSQQRKWPCHPGAIDGIMGPKTENAVKKFQESYNADPEFPEDIEVDGIAKKETWMAFFDIYQSTLVKMSGLTQTEFDAQFRGSPQWKDSFKLTGCGESWPIDQADKDNYRSQTNRRVEVLIFNMSEAPALACVNGKCEGKSCPVYGVGPDGKRAFQTERIFYDNASARRREEG
jgi:type VI secretion system secreted protein Hcp